MPGLIHDLQLRARSPPSYLLMQFSERRAPQIVRMDGSCPFQFGDHTTLALTSFVARALMCVVIVGTNVPVLNEQHIIAPT